MGNSEEKKEITLTNVVSTVIQIPGVKVNKSDFIREQFKEFERERLEVIIAKGPVKAGLTREVLSKKATRLINERTLTSGGASFLAGLPGGLAMAATIPADIIQFYGVALRLAQELAYLYGEEDLWKDHLLDKDRVTNQLMLYCGVMLGASGAAQTVRVLSSSLAKQALKKLPQKALTKTIYYPIIKSIAKAFSVKMTKEVFAKGIAKALPIVGGVVSGGITLATMKPMGKRLADALDEAHFDYTQKEFEADWAEIIEITEREETELASNSVESNMPEADNGINVTENTGQDNLDKIRKAKEMLDAGIVTEEEFSALKTKLLELL